MRRRLTAAVLVLLAACGPFPVSDDVVIELHDSAQATVTVKTSFDTKSGSAPVRARVDAAREAALAGTDAWSMRFSRLTPETERVTMERVRGQLDSVTRSVTIADDDLQRAFSDASLTFSIVDGEGWRELRIYPGTSSRATREQRLHFEAAMKSWSEEVARYFRALAALYAYADAHPGRAKYVFGALFEERNPDETPVAVTEDEQPLVDAVSAAIETIQRRMDIEEGAARSFAEEADLVFNPFPARFTIRVPGAILESRGFEARDGAAVIERVDLFESIAALEGRWITPDPLAASLHDENQLTAAEFAELPRRWSAMVSATDIEAALREKMQRPSAYVLRWRD